MAQVSVRINGRSYDVACEDGQEERLTQLAGYVDERVGEIASMVGQIGEQRLLVMTSLLIADELSDAHEKLSSARQVSLPEGAVGPNEADRMAQSMENLAGRIEAIAQRLSAD
ncbi:cell division protein ZapA [Thalassospira marina]|uniref:Cell division protein ZapA n=1 Tax=Thalassospira marina TaxID=2048283 RepID=A0A2N3KS61_9PROT|nr:cell division protein ZapA [Thalassospira marina]AUG52463.1 cell division protein ZapA [Thalassospira marina]PKR53419.1 cell division protein ZapA [Thalassospira marina]